LSSSTATADPVAEPALSPWTPLRIRVFRALWLASLVSNIGSWMHLVAAPDALAEDVVGPALVEKDERPADRGDDGHGWGYEAFTSARGVL
jgi:hypothetical protein